MIRADEKRSVNLTERFLEGRGKSGSQGEEWVQEGGRLNQLERW